MALQNTALDRMFEQTLPRQRGTSEPRLPHGTAGIKRGNTSHAGTRTLVRNNAGFDAIGRASRYSSSKIDRLAGRVMGVRRPAGW